MLQRDPGGVVRIVAQFNQRARDPLRIDLSFLLRLPCLWQPIASGFRLHFDQLSVASIANASRDLRAGLFAFLFHANRTEVTLSDMTSDFWAAFIHWLDSTDSNGVEKLKLQTRARRLGTMRSVLMAISRLDRFRGEAEKALEYLPHSPWRALQRKVTPRKRLNREHLLSILKASVEEILALDARFKDGAQRIKKGRAELESGSHNIRTSLDALLAAVDREFPLSIPRKAELKESQKPLEQAARIHAGGITKLSKYLYPAPREMVPMVLVLSIVLGMNPETILSLNWSDIRLHQVLGREVAVIRGVKNRASKNPEMSVPASIEVWKGLSLGDVLGMLRRWTDRIRPGISLPAHRDRVFIFVGEPVTHSLPRGFGGSTTSTQYMCCTDIAFTHNLKRFVRDHGIEAFSLAQIRTTVLDETFVLTGDIKAVQAIGQQKSPWTVLNHYTSDGTRSRLMERLGGSLFLLRERWWGSDGRIDPRVGGRGFGRDRGAATPGFQCMDPFSSQRPGQIEGRLCTAYGECPDCELAVGTDSVEDVANYLALRAQLLKFVSETSEQVWARQWSPVLQSLDQMLALVPSDVASRAQKYRVHLPAIG